MKTNIIALALVSSLSISCNIIAQKKSVDLKPGISSAETSVTSSDEEGFKMIFDGKTLDGWHGDPTYWSVKNGTLYGEITPETIVERNTFIIWQGEMPSNFELKLEYRVSEHGNSGINYRSELVEGVPYALKGYQADLDGQKKYVGSNYEERKRTTLASQGEVVLIPDSKDGSLKKYAKENFWSKRKVLSKLGDKDKLKNEIHGSESWNEYHLIIDGNRLKHIVNGVLMSDVTDNDSVNSSDSGFLGVQVHVGPPMTVEYRNIRIKELK